MKADGWIERVTHLNQWIRGGERAPHKPLLLLYALGRLQRTGSASVAFIDAEPDLKRLLCRRDARQHGQWVLGCHGGRLRHTVR